ncbi:organic hydroperoxide resistance protein, partial [Mesorhizobium sp. M8A.F.Ca.ET.165.01.1.1]
TVSLHPNDQGGFRLGVALAAEIKGLGQASAEALVSEAHKICPYSNAIRGNIDVVLSATALPAKAA